LVVARVETTDEVKVDLKVESTVVELVAWLVE